MGATEATTDLQSALARFREALFLGRTVSGASEEFFEEAATPISRLRAKGPLEGTERELVRTAVDILLDAGRTLFSKDPEAAVILGNLLARAKHFAGALSPDPGLEGLLEELNRDWHRRLF